MKRKAILIATTCLSLALPVFAGGKKHAQRAMIEKMEAVPCGAKERGVTGIGSVFASIGATHVDSDEKLCPQYTVLTDEMQYDIRPTDLKHAVILPVGKEIEFKIKKNRMYLKVPDAHEKMQTYEVVAMKPTSSDASAKAASAKSDSN